MSMHTPSPPPLPDTPPPPPPPPPMGQPVGSKRPRTAGGPFKTVLGINDVPNAGLFAGGGGTSIGPGDLGGGKA